MTAMRRARRMCRNCPFRGIDETEREELAKIPSTNWPCHDEQGYWAECDVQCRGHWEAQRKFSTASGEAERSRKELEADKPGSYQTRTAAPVKPK